MAKARGFDVKVRISGVTYSVAEYSCDDEAPENDVSNSEGETGSGLGAGSNPEFKSVVASQRQMRVMLRSATYDPDSNPFAAPLAIETGMYLTDVSIFPAGLSESPIAIPVLYVRRASIGGPVSGVQPVTIEGVSDGSYTWPV